MKYKDKKFKNSDDLFLEVGLSPEQIMIANFRVEICMAIGKRMAGLGKTQEELAEKVGTSQANISRILNHNIGKLSTDLLLRVLAVLGGKARVDTSFRHDRQAS